MTDEKTVHARIADLTGRDLAEISSAAAYQQNQTDLEFRRSKTPVAAEPIRHARGE